MICQLSRNDACVDGSFGNAILVSIKQDSFLFAPLSCSDGALWVGFAETGEDGIC